MNGNSFTLNLCTQIHIAMKSSRSYSKDVRHMQRGLRWGAMVVANVVIVGLQAAIATARLMRCAGLTSNVKQASVLFAILPNLVI